MSLGHLHEKFSENLNGSLRMPVKVNALLILKFLSLFAATITSTDPVSDFYTDLLSYP